jgi:phage gpG-like protein
MITFKIKRAQETKDILQKYPDIYKKALIEGIRKAILFAEAESKKSFGQSGNLKVKTGYLRRSIQSSVDVRYNLITASLFTDVIYAPIHEFGGKIKAKNSGYLNFSVGGRWVKIKEVTIPTRPFLEPAIVNNQQKLDELISDTITKEVNNGL